MNHFLDVFHSVVLCCCCVLSSVVSFVEVGCLVITMECDGNRKGSRDKKKKGRGEAVKGRHKLKFWGNINRL